MCEVCWLIVLQFLRLVVEKGSLDTWRNNNKKDSTESKKRIKDSEVIWNLLMTKNEEGDDDQRQ